MIACIVAKSPQGVIGADGWMPWDLPEDLRHFKKTTLHQTLVMGRKTFEYIAKPLPNRKTFVISRNKNLSYPYPTDVVEVIDSIDELVERYRKSDDWLYVCGGAAIYQLFLPYIDRFIISEVKKEYDGDTFFPSLNHVPLTLVEQISYDDFDVMIYDRRYGL